VANSARVTAWAWWITARWVADHGKVDVTEATTLLVEGMKPGLFRTSLEDNACSKVLKP